MRYPVKVTWQSVGNYAVRFPDIPEAVTLGDTKDEALRHAADALESALDFYFEDGRPVPLPSAPKRGYSVVELPPTVTAKVLLHNEMIAQKIRPAELARRLNIPRQNVSRLLNRNPGTSIDGLAGALAALGKRLDVTIS
jgi:antitoxin HicB